LITAPDALSKTRLEYLWKTYTAILDWIKFSDTKAAAVLAANGAVVGITLTNAETINTLSDKSIVLQMLLIIGGLSLYASAILCLLSLIPNLSVGEPSSIIFFAHIAHKSKTVHDYNQAIDTVFNNNKEVNQIADQIWAISRVAKRKYFLIGWGIRCFAGMIITTLVFIALGVLIH